MHLLPPAACNHYGGPRRALQQQGAKMWVTLRGGTSSPARAFRRALTLTGSSTRHIVTSWPCDGWVAGSTMASGPTRVGWAHVHLPTKEGCPVLSTLKGACWTTVSIWSCCPREHHTCLCSQRPLPLLPPPLSMRPTTCSCSGPSACWWPAVREAAGPCWPPGWWRTPHTSWRSHPPVSCSPRATCSQTTGTLPARPHARAAAEQGAALHWGTSTEPGFLIKVDNIQPLMPTWWAPDSSISPATMRHPSFAWSRTSSTRTTATGPQPQHDLHRPAQESHGQVPCLPLGQESVPRQQRDPEDCLLRHHFTCATPCLILVSLQGMGE